MTALLLNSVTFNRPHVLYNQTEQYPGNVYAHPNPFQAETITFAFSDNHVIKFSVPKDPNGVHLGPCLFGKYNNDRFLFMLIDAVWNYEDAEVISPMMATFEITTLADHPVEWFRHHFNILCEYLAEQFPLMKMQFSELYTEAALTHNKDTHTVSLLTKQAVTGIWNHLMSWHILPIARHWVHTSMTHPESLLAQLAVRQPVEWTMDEFNKWKLQLSPNVVNVKALQLHLTSDVTKTLYWLLRTSPEFAVTVLPNKRVHITQTSEGLNLLSGESIAIQSTCVGVHYVVLSSKYTLDSLVNNPIIIEIENEECSYD